MTQTTVLIDQTFNTEKGNIRFLIDLKTFLDYLGRYTTKLCAARGIPQDLNNISPMEPLLMVASKMMDWATPNEVYVEVGEYFQAAYQVAQRDAMVLAATRLNPEFSFEPEPYTEDDEPAERWEMELPAIKHNLRHPLEKRLKCVLDVISSDVSVYAQFYNAIQNMMIEAERRTRQAATDEDGFHDGRSGGTTHPEVVADSQKPEISQESAGLVGLLGRYEDTE